MRDFKNHATIGMMTVPLFLLVGINLLSILFTVVILFLYRASKKGYPLPESSQTKLFGCVHFRGAAHAYLLFSVTISAASLGIYFALFGV